MKTNIKTKNHNIAAVSYTHLDVYKRQEITLATVENTLKDVVFYPNPIEANLNINFGKKYHKIEVEVFDGSGRKVYQNNFMNKNTVQLQLKLSSGVYQLILKADEKVTSRKILRR